MDAAQILIRRICGVVHNVRNENFKKSSEIHYYAKDGVTGVVTFM